MYLDFDSTYLALEQPKFSVASAWDEGQFVVAFTLGVSIRQHSVSLQPQEVIADLVFGNVEISFALVSEEVMNLGTYASFLMN
jgi:ABC-type iron transport system FetAB permease component